MVSLWTIYGQLSDNFRANFGKLAVRVDFGRTLFWTIKRKYVKPNLFCFLKLYCRLSELTEPWTLFGHILDTFYSIIFFSILQVFNIFLHAYFAWNWQSICHSGSNYHNFERWVFRLDWSLYQISWSFGFTCLHPWIPVWNPSRI